MAVPSFKIASPSINVESFLLAPISFKIATTATGSDADITAPNIKATGQVQFRRPIFKFLIPISRTAVSPSAISIPGPASKVALTDVLRKVCQSIPKAASKIRVGRNTKNTT